jgi:hypothetical protein
MTELTLKQKLEAELASLEQQAAQLLANMNALAGAKMAITKAIAFAGDEAKKAEAAVEAEFSTPAAPPK